MPFGSVEQMSGAYEAQIAAFDQVNRVECALLVDLRLVPPRNDPAFEGVVARYQERLYAGFRKVAIVVKFEAGRLQLSRMMAPEDAPRFRAFLDEQAAVGYLLTRPADPGPLGRRRR
jgi:hypothetical protein